jgi:molybdopterin converting factor small subunit
MNKHGQAVSNGTISIRCRFFARFAELLGRDGCELTVPAGATVSDAVQLVRQAVEHGDRLPDTPLTAVNCEHVHADHRLADGDELAFLPPLAGG